MCAPIRVRHHGPERRSSDRSTHAAHLSSVKAAAAGSHAVSSIRQRRACWAHPRRATRPQPGRCGLESGPSCCGAGGRSWATRHNLATPAPERRGAEPSERGCRRRHRRALERRRVQASDGAHRAPGMALIPSHATVCDGWLHRHESAGGLATDGSAPPSCAPSFVPEVLTSGAWPPRSLRPVDLAPPRPARARSCPGAPP
jgi:hypothetical protein